MWHAADCSGGLKMENVQTVCAYVACRAVWFVETENVQTVCAYVACRVVWFVETEHVQTVCLCGMQGGLVC